MKILFASSEVVPFAKTGGLADVAGTLPKAIAGLGHDIRIFMPRYKQINPANLNLKLVAQGIEVELGKSQEKVDVYEGKVPQSNVIIYFVESRYFANRTELYMQDGHDYPDNCEAFLTFCKSILSFAKKINWIPDIVHANDWQSAPLVLYTHELRKIDAFFQRTATVYSVHNMAYQGNFPREKFVLSNLPDSFFVSDGLEAWGKISFAKAGFVYSDVINTVSDTYAKEIQTKEFGCGLEGLLQKRAADVYGIVNGIDYDHWNPALDPAIAKRYSRGTLSLKAQNKLALQQEMELPQNEEVPIIGMISRLDPQKGFDLVADKINEIMQMACQLIVLGVGDEKYHKLLNEMKKKYPEHIGIRLEFAGDLAQRIYAGSDMFLMPSHYEPCGLGQLISFKYGTIPIVRKTGGLADTVHDYTLDNTTGDGFVFSEYNSTVFLDAVTRALEAYKDKNAWKKIQERAMDYDYSWAASAKKYISLYVKALNKVIK